MNINAKQLTSIDFTRFDNTTSLGFFGQIEAIAVKNAQLTAAMGSVWTRFAAARNAFDVAYAQARKWAQTEDISDLDKLRDQALSAFLNALNAMLASPNAQKQQAAKQLKFIRDKYSLSAADEYMKETTAIQQMLQEMESTAEARTALQTTALDDWFEDLKQKNAAFLAKMNERTEAQAGMEKGIVRDRRNQCEAAYRDVVKLLNALAIVEYPEGMDYTAPINLLNAEIEHYRQILARKGVGSGSSSASGGSTTPATDDAGTNPPSGDNTGGGSGDDDDAPGPGGGDDIPSGGNPGGNTGGGSGGNDDDDAPGPGGGNG